MFDPSKDPQEMFGMSSEQVKRAEEVLDNMTEDERRGILKMTQLMLEVMAMTVPALSNQELLSDAVPKALKMPMDPYAHALIETLAQRLRVKNLIGDEEPTPEETPTNE